VNSFQTSFILINCAIISLSYAPKIKHKNTAFDFQNKILSGFKVLDDAFYLNEIIFYSPRYVAFSFNRYRFNLWFVITIFFNNLVIMNRVFNFNILAAALFNQLCYNNILISLQIQIFNILGNFFQ